MERPLCKICGKRPVERQYLPGLLEVRWKTKCYRCRRPELRLDAESRRRAKDLSSVPDSMLKCSRCGFVPEHQCQMDVDHKNGDHNDNRPENRQLICSNCHRLKTFINKDWEKAA